LSTLCIVTRCVFRVAELSHGWSGHLMKVQRYFIGLEGAIIVAAVFFLNVFHPGLCFRETPGTERTGERMWVGRRKMQTEARGVVELTVREDKAQEEGGAAQAQHQV
jgi:hypothetical protein